MKRCAPGREPRLCGSAACWAMPEKGASGCQGAPPCACNAACMDVCCLCCWRAPQCDTMPREAVAACCTAGCGILVHGQRPNTTVSLQVPGLEPFRGSLEEIYDKFNKYKRTVPVRCVPVSFLLPSLTCSPGDSQALQASPQACWPLGAALAMPHP